MSVFDDVYKALASQAQISFDGVVGDIEQHVLPSMASLARNIVVIAARLADGIYTQDMADSELDAQKDAVASVIVRFANDVLKAIEDIIDAVLSAVATAVNRLLGVVVLV